MDAYPLSLEFANRCSAAAPTPDTSGVEFAAVKTLEDWKKYAILRSLESTKGNVMASARQLEISTRTLRDLLIRWGATDEINRARALRRKDKR